MTEEDYHFKSRNRTTTYESLLAVVGLIFAEDKETYAYYYEKATHDDSGYSSWTYLISKRSNC